MFSSTQLLACEGQSDIDIALPLEYLTDPDAVCWLTKQALDLGNHSVSVSRQAVQWHRQAH
jgi:hypothetical protein